MLPDSWSGTCAFITKDERQFGSFPTKTKARQFYQKAKAEQHEGRFFPERFQRGGFAALDAVLKEYLDTFTGRSKRDEERFKSKWQGLFPGIRLNAITPALLEKARAQLLNGRTPQTVNRYMGFLRRVLNKAVRDGQLAQNPVSRLKMYRESTGRTRFLSVDDEGKLFRALGPVHGPWMRLAILTGMRQMEQFSMNGSK